MVLINFKQQCNIPTFSRARKGWAKKISGLDKEYPNGYSLQGEFITLGNFDTNLTDGIYLDCSKKANDDGEVEKTYHLFTVTNGEIQLLQTESDCKGWAVKFWDNIENYFNKDGLTAQALINMLKERTNDKDLLKEVAQTLLEKEQESCFTDYWNTTHWDGIAQAMDLLSMDDGYFLENKEKGKSYEKGKELLKEHDGFELFEDAFYKSASVRILKPKIVRMLNLFYGENLWDEDAPKIKLEYHNEFENVNDFNLRSTVNKWRKIFKETADIGFYSLSQEWTNTWSVRGIMIFHYDEKNRVLVAHKFGAYFP